MRSSYRAALAHREFRVLFVSQLVSISGTTIAAVALTVLVYQRTASPFLSASTFALGFVPYALGGGLLSALVDRVQPRRLVARCDSASALVAAGMAWPGAPTPLLLALLVVVGLATSVSGGARVALVRAAVPDSAYVPARSLLRVVAQLAQIGGNGAGGALLVVLTPSGAILANAVSFAASAALVRFGIRERELIAPQHRASLLHDSLAGIRTVFADRVLRRLILLGWLVPTFSVAPEALAAPSIADRGGSPALVGVWLLALPIGMVAGDLLGVWRLTSDRQRRLVAPMAAAAALPYVAFLADPPLPFALALLVASGVCSVYSLGLDLRLRDASPDRLFARVMTISSAGQMTLQGVGFALAGAQAELIGASTAIAVAGVCGLCAALAFAPWRAGQTSETVVSSRAAA